VSDHAGHREGDGEVRELIEREIQRMAVRLLYTGTNSTARINDCESSSITHDDTMRAISLVVDQAPFKLKIITDPYLIKDEEYLTFKPRSKKKRIQKKARKLYTRYRQVPNVEYAYHIPSRNAIVCHPVMDKLIRNATVTGQVMYEIEPE
jgi:hypothetical protein